MVADKPADPAPSLAANASARTPAATDTGAPAMPTADANAVDRAPQAPIASAMPAAEAAQPVAATAPS
ncbi:chemotaxis protein CheA, partial [Burkholderia vietnamiensis]|nr:chemotaxis protein CheA [Burkholderia vietnamiensis]